MKKRILILIACCICLGLAACGTETKKESESVTDSAPAEEAPGSEKQDDAAAAADTVTEDEALEAIKKYCSVNHPEVNEKLDSDEYTMYWSVSTNENNEIVVLFRSYTGALTRYYVDPATGQTYVTEQVPGIIDDEQRTEETLNIKDYE